MHLVISRADLNALPAQCRKHTTASKPLPFVVMAYAFGQFCLPYLVPVTHRKVRATPFQGAL